MNFLYAASYGELIAVWPFIVNNALVYLSHLQKEVAYKSQDVRITLFRLDDGKSVFRVIAISSHRIARNLKFIQREIGVL